MCGDAFPDGRIRFTEIVDTVAGVVEEHDSDRFGAATLAEVLAADAWARERAAAALGLGQ